MLRSVEWENIRTEKFSLTPVALFENFVRTAESLISRQAAEIHRRQEWLADASSSPEQDDQDRATPIIVGSVDKYGIDLEDFKMKTGKKPLRWQLCSFVSRFHSSV